MDGNAILQKLEHLSQAQSMKDVKPLTAAMFPGTHCPLMGAAMAVRGIKDAVILVVGTDECTYYTKHMTLYSEDFGGVEGRCLSVVLNTHDVTFGCGKTLEKAFKEMMDEYHPKAVYLVTTCVVELIGDDMDSMAWQLEEQYGIPVMAVHTEHFKCDNHLPGLERTLTASFDMMEPMECDGSVNLLGQRMGNFEDTELYRILTGAGVKIGLQIPCGCTVDDIRRGAAAKVNIVTNAIALPLAKKMEKRFHIPYVIFDKYTDPGRIRDAYQRLFVCLDLPWTEELDSLYQKAMEAKALGSSQLSGITYIYGNTPFSTFEFNRFMVSMGMVPLIIQLSSFGPEDRPDMDAILESADPYVTKSANIAPLQYVYDILRPHLYLGHEYAARLRKKGIAMVRTDGASSMLGFEITTMVVKELIRASEEARELHGERRETA